MAFREVAREALELARVGPAGALAAADLVLGAAERYKKGLADSLQDELAPFLDERGRAEDAYRGAIRRIEERHKRQVRRAERDYVDRVLLAASALLRDRVVAAVGGGPDLLMNPDVAPGAATGTGAVREAAGGVSACEEARAELAEDVNLNPRLVLEHAFLRLGQAAGSGTGSPGRERWGQRFAERGAGITVGRRTRWDACRGGRCRGCPGTDRR
jgi:hypothetical protein